MSININQVLDYLDNHPVCQQAGCMDSLLETLCDIYLSHSNGNSGEIYALFARLRSCMAGLRQSEQDALFDAVTDLCGKHEVLAFSQGFLVGMLLMSEIRMIP